MKYYAVERTGPYLAHHGILGQKWGVRRFQNKDGSLTSAGKKRYRDMTTDEFDKEVYDYMTERSHKGLIRSSFEKARDQVLARCSNKIVPLDLKKATDADVSQVMERGKLTPDEAMQCMDLAVRRFREAARQEPRDTRDVVAAVSSVGAKMYGLEHRLKTPISLAAKIGADAKGDYDGDFNWAAMRIHDAVRYTAVLDDRTFVDNYNQIKRELDKRGWYEMECKNYFQRYRAGRVKHKAIQSTFVANGGKDFDNTFELQFHTASSQAAKELKLPLYNERRKAGISPKRARQLERKMTNLAEKVSDPWGVYEIEEHMS